MDRPIWAPPDADIDPIAVAHSLAILRDNPNATAIQADLRDLPAGRPDRDGQG